MMGMSSVFMGEAKQNFQENESTISPIDHMAPHTVTQVTVRPLLCALCQSVQKLAWDWGEGKP